ncbi:hypothetical protein Tco_0319774 [Tanacetum coccineum]
MANTRRIWKSIRYGVSKELDTAYWGFLGAFIQGNSLQERNCQIREIFKHASKVLILILLLILSKDHLAVINVVLFDTPAGNPVKKILLKLESTDPRTSSCIQRLTPTKHGPNDKAKSDPPGFIATLIYFKEKIKDVDGGT